MPAYIVRIKKDHDLVGFFYASNRHDLIITVDECTDPGACEYQRLPVGGIMWTSPAIPVPIPEALDPEDSVVDPMPWGQATATELWWYVIQGLDDRGWKPFFKEDPDETPPEPKPARKLDKPAQVLPFRKKR